MKMKGLLILLLALLFAASINSCQIPTISQTLAEKITSISPVLPILTTTASESVNNSPVISPSNFSETPCAFMWASQFLPDESQRIEQLLNQADFENVRVVAEAFGENCVDADGQIVRFATMQTDIRLFVTVQSLSSVNELGDLTGRLLKILFEIPSSALPGTQAGYIGIQFISDQHEVLNLWFKRNLAEELLQSGIQGEDLLHELQK